MTNRARIILWSVAAGVVGLVIGCVLAAYGIVYILRMDEDSKKLMKVVHVREEVLLLSSLRTGDNDRAIEILESDLDGDILELALDRGISTAMKGKVSKTIKVVGEYRVKFPRKTAHAEIDNAVQSVLSR